MDRVHGTLRWQHCRDRQSSHNSQVAVTSHGSQRGHGEGASLPFPTPLFRTRHPRWPSAGRHDDGGGGGAEAAQGAAGARAHPGGGRALRRLLPPRRMRRQQVRSPSPPTHPKSAVLSDRVPARASRSSLLCSCVLQSVLFAAD